MPTHRLGKCSRLTGRDQGRATRALRSYNRVQQAVQLEAVRRTQEAAARKEEWVRKNVPVFAAATEGALQRLEAHGFPEAQLHRCSMDVRKQFLFLTRWSRVHTKKIGWDMSRQSYGDSGVTLLADGTFHMHGVWSSDRDSPGVSWINYELTVEDLVRRLYHFQDQGAAILARLSTMGSVPPDSAH